MCVDTGYYATFNRPNVHLVDLRETPIEEITPEGIRTTDAAARARRDRVRHRLRRDDRRAAARSTSRAATASTLQDAWEAGPRTYLGLGVAGFPNLFIITGPGSPSVLTNMLVSIQHHVEWIADCIAHMRDAGPAPHRGHCPTRRSSGSTT